MRLEENGEKLIVQEPLAGEYQMGWEKFSELWYGRGVWAEKI